MASLPAASRPKTAQEIKDFVQKYTSLISQLQSHTTSIQSTKMTSTAQKLTTSSQPSVKSTLTSGPVVVPLNFGPAPSTTSATPPVTTTQAVISSTAMAVDQHFQNSLSAAKMKSTLTGPTPPSKTTPTWPTHCSGLDSGHRDVSIWYSLCSCHHPIQNWH